MFWNSTLGEISIYINAYNKRREIENKEKAEWIYTLGALNGMAYASFSPFNDGKAKYPKIYEVFPLLFKEEKPQQQDWQIMKETLMKFAHNHNQQFNKRGE